jgi:hypothetical protein
MSTRRGRKKNEHHRNQQHRLEKLRKRASSIKQEGNEEGDTNNQ